MPLCSPRIQYFSNGYFKNKTSLCQCDLIGFWGTRFCRKTELWKRVRHHWFLQCSNSSLCCLQGSICCFLVASLDSTNAMIRTMNYFSAKKEKCTLLGSFLRSGLHQMKMKYPLASVSFSSYVLSLLSSPEQQQKRMAHHYTLWSLHLAQHWLVK